MRFSTIVAAFAGVAATCALSANAQAPGVAGLATAIRKEVREMSEDEWSTYADAVKQLQRNGFWQSMADIHAENFQRGIHRNPVFFPWHRAYLRLMEEQLSTVAGKTVTIPYWDWTLDSADMGGSPIFTAKRFGSMSRKKRWGGCVKNGPFQTLHVPAQLGEERCLRRGRSYDGNGYDRAAVLRRFVNKRGKPFKGKRGYDKVRAGIETIHNSVHSSIQGDMGGVSSPLDPIFYSHHMMIDNLWSAWQARDPANMRAYDGAASDMLADLGSYSVEDTFDIRPFKPLEDEFASTAGVASLLAARAGDIMGTVEFTASESIEALTALNSMSAKQLDQVPRTCAAPLRGNETDMFWDAESAEPIIAEMEARFELAQRLGLKETPDCLPSAADIERLANGEDLEGNNVDDAGLSGAGIAGISAALVGLVAVVAGVALSRRKNEVELFADVPQGQLAAGDAFPEL